MALAGKETYCLISDGESNEGSIWEALRLKTDLHVDRLHVYANLNGFTALALIDTQRLGDRLKLFCPDIELRFTDNPEGYEGVAGHYDKAK